MLSPCTIVPDPSRATTPAGPPASHTVRLVCVRVAGEEAADVRVLRRDSVAVAWRRCRRRRPSPRFPRARAPPTAICRVALGSGDSLGLRVSRAACAPARSYERAPAPDHAAPGRRRYAHASASRADRRPRRCPSRRRDRGNQPLPSQAAARRVSGTVERPASSTNLSLGRRPRSRRRGRLQGGYLAVVGRLLSAAAERPARMRAHFCAPSRPRRRLPGAGGGDCGGARSRTFCASNLLPCSLIAAPSMAGCSIRADELAALRSARQCVLRRRAADLPGSRHSVLAASSGAGERHTRTATARRRHGHGPRRRRPAPPSPRLR